MGKFIALQLNVTLIVLFLLSAANNIYIFNQQENKIAEYSADISPLSNSTYLPAFIKSDCIAPNPSWKVLVLVYATTDFLYTDTGGINRHFHAELSQTELNKIDSQVNRFVSEDISALNSCNMKPTITIRYPDDTLSNLTPSPCSDYAPWPGDVAGDRDPNFDSVITIWDGSGIDLNSGDDLSIQGCAYAWNMGTGQLYATIFADFVTIYNGDSRNVFKHEWGHSILFYFNAVGTAPEPPVDNHINDTTNQYVNCLTGHSYILEDETDSNPIPNSIYNNYSGFTHDYYSGFTATADQPARCLGITSEAWASGGPVTKSPLRLNNGEFVWQSPDDDVILGVVSFSP